MGLLTHSESGKAAEAEPIITAILDELEAAGYGRDVGSKKSLDWDDPDDRRLVREAFGDGGADEAILPGFGEAGQATNARPDCGNPHPFVCDSCGHSVEMGRTCAMSVCARCASVWTRDTGIRKAGKLRRVRLEKEYSIDHLNQKRHHLAFMPPLEWFYDLARAGFSREDALETTRLVVKSILDEFRAQGILARHSYTGKDEDGHIKTEDDDLGEWKNRLYERRRWDDDVRDILAWKPHFHAVVISDWIQGGELTSDVYDATGWVIRRITGHGDEGYSLEQDGDMARALTYNISHADILVNDDGNNRSAIWEVGSFQGDPIKSSGRFSARPQDLDWADGAVRRIAFKILGIQSGTTDCGKNIPAVDDPDELARKILEELYPDDPELRAQISPDQVLHLVNVGLLEVDVETTEGGGGDVRVLSFGGPTAGTVDLPDRLEATELPREPESLELPRSDEAWDAPASVLTSSVTRELLDENGEECGCGEEHDDDQDDVEPGEPCNGTLIPLDEARRRGLLEDDEWLSSATFADEALAADREWLELDPWRSESPGKAAPGIG